jgi:hypothetical protein
MGTSGSGRLTDYPGSSKPKTNGGDGEGGGGIPSADRCARAISANLEDVEHCTYFKTHKISPPLGTQLHIAHQKRLVAQTDAGEVVGNLPTRFNYLAACMEDGYTYVGKVRDSSNGPPIAIVAADFAAVSPK